MLKISRLILTLLPAVLLFSPSFAQSEKERIQSYVNQYKELAIIEMLRTGVPASITLAQGILETAGGQSDLAALGNNHFGIKCKSEWMGETMLHDDNTKNECFRKYSSAEESYKDHSDFLKSRPCYAFLFKLDPTDYEGWAKGLKKAGYATNSAYSQSLIRLIVENNLQNYTLMALQSGDLQNTVAVAENTPKNAEEDNALAQNAESTQVLNTAKSLNANNNGYPANSIFVINDLKVVYAEPGTSLFALANNYHLSYKKLLEFNDLDETDILKAGQLIFLEKKSKKGPREIHIVESNETLHDISQKEGVQLSAVMEYNGLHKGMEPATGEKIYLKYPAPAAPKLAFVPSLKASSSM